MINAAITLWLLLTQPVTTFVVVKSFLGPGFTTLTFVIAFGWLRFSSRNNGVRFVFAPAANGVPRRSVVASQ